MPALTQSEITKEKRRIHAAAFGYEPLGIKPIHLLHGLLLALDPRAYRLERLNQAVVTSAKKGLAGNYLSEAFHQLSIDEGRVAASVSPESLWQLRLHNQALFNNDQAAWPAYVPGVGQSGVDYTTTSRRLVCKARRIDGCAGPFLIEVMRMSDAGRSVIAALERWTTAPNDSLQRLAEPWLADDREEEQPHHAAWESGFPDASNRAAEAAESMNSQTEALAMLVQHFDANVSPSEALRHLVIGFGCWMTTYLLRSLPRAESGSRIIFCDFSGVPDSRTRHQSRLCYRRWAEAVEDYYADLHEAGSWASDYTPAEVFPRKQKAGEAPQPTADFDFLRDHFNELTLRMGLAKPRSGFANKHFEPQPDTLRCLLLSVVERGHIVRLDDLAQRLRETWGIVFGGRPDDRRLLARHGYQGLDGDDLRANQGGFIRLARSLSMAREPSDGLVLFGQHIDTLI